MVTKPCYKKKEFMLIHQLELNEKRTHNAEQVAAYNELDLFYNQFKKPIITITGTLGKKVISATLAQCLTEQNVSIATMERSSNNAASILEKQNYIDAAIIEMPLPQLMSHNIHASHLMLWHNFYPHIDQNTVNLQSLFEKKLSAHLLLPIELAHKVTIENLHHTALHTTHISAAQLEHAQQHYQMPIFCIEKEHIVRKYNRQSEILFPLTLRHDNVMLPNLVATIAALHMLGKEIKLPQLPITIEDRLQLITNYDGIAFYNDAKAVTMQATVAATETLALQKKPIFLFLAGTANDIDKEHCIKKLSAKVTHVFCFGAQTRELAILCRRHALNVTEHKTLEEAFAVCKQKVAHNSIVLFSPGSDNCDLFENYQASGEAFKKWLFSWYR